PYDPGRHPWERFILEALSPDDPCREVTEKKSAQIGGTIVALIFTVGSQDLDPGPFLYTHPTANNAVRWSRTKFTAFLDHARPGLLATRSRDGAASATLKARSDGRGFVAIAGANSAATLSEISVSKQVQDDLAKWPDDNEAGDPEGQANSRSGAFRFAKILKVGTPGIWPGCRVTRSYLAGTQEQLHLACPHCGHEHPLEWANLEPYIDPADPDSAHFVCPDCGGAIEHRHLAGMLAKVGPHSMVARNPKARQRSFYVWAAYAPSTTWAEIARKWLAAKGEPLSERVFFNDVLGLAYEVSGEAPDYSRIQERADDVETGYQPGLVPMGGLLLVLAIDVQGDRVEVHVKAFGRDGRRWTVEYKIVPGFIAEERVRAELDSLLASRWRCQADGQLGVDLLAIDGNAYTEDVWAWVKGKPRSKVEIVVGGVFAAM
ncbi:MAG: terminase gpA endonuclease subunit, partial [Tistlia sp.]